MSIQIIEIRQFQGPATVELSGVGVPEIVEVRQGPAGVNGPNSVTSATTSDGTANLSLSNVTTATATVTGTLNAAHIHGNVAGSVYAHVRAGENLAKGDPVYISGSHGTGASLIAIVSKADASNAAKMPAVGVMDAAVSNNANGHMVITGTLSDINTNGYTVNSPIYVANGGGYSNIVGTIPQQIGTTERSNSNNGAFIVSNSKVLTTADISDLANGTANLFVNSITADLSLSTNGSLTSAAVSTYQISAPDSSAVTFPDGIKNPFGSACILPTSGGTLATIDDIPVINYGFNVVSFLETPTSANLAAAVTDETGSGSLVFANLPTLTSPTLLNIPEATLAAIATLTGQTGAPPVVLFDDFYGSGNTTVGMWTWQDGTTGTAGTGSVDAGNTANGSSQYAGMCRISTAAVSGNGRTRFLNIGSSGKMIGAQWRACFAIPDITNVRITIGGQGGGGAYELRYDSSANSGQWVLAIAVNSVYTIYTFTTATALAGDFQSGKRYRMSLTRTSTTLCTLVLEIADYNLANWSDVFRGTITHLAHFENLQAWQPMFTVTALEAVVKRLCVDWISVYNPNILR